MKLEKAVKRDGRKRIPKVHKSDPNAKKEEKRKDWKSHQNHKKERTTDEYN